MTHIEQLIAGFTSAPGVVSYKQLAHHLARTSSRELESWAKVQDPEMMIHIGYTRLNEESGIVQVKFGDATDDQKRIAYDNFLSRLFK